MKKLLLIFASFAFIFQLSYAQAKFGVRAGVSTYDITPGQILGTNNTDNESLQIAIEDASYGFHFGAFARFGKTFYIQPEVLFNSNSVDYKIENTSFNRLVNEKYTNIDIPLMLGVKLGPLRGQIGPVAHYFLDSDSGFFDAVTNYDPQFNDWDFGWQAGLGLDLWSVSIDLKYERNNLNLGDHINIDGNAYSSDENPARIIATLGIAF